MSHSVKPGVATGNEVQEIFALAKSKQFALPAVNVIGSDTINAVLETAAKLNAPVIIQFSNGGAQFNAGKGLSNGLAHAGKLVFPATRGRSASRAGQCFDLAVRVFDDPVLWTGCTEARCRIKQINPCRSTAGAGLFPGRSDRAHRAEPVRLRLFGADIYFLHLCG